MLEEARTCLQIERSIVGSILVIGDEVRTDPLPIHKPVLLPPAGPEYHYAPLAWITGPDQALDLREVFRPGSTYDSRDRDMEASYPFLRRRFTMTILVYLDLLR